MTSPNRLPQGGALIDRARPLSFSFDGETLPGFVGDTLASALLARGVRPLARSFKYRRPRGIYSAGIEEPCAIVTVGEGALLEPGARAPMVDLFDGLVAKSQSGWPSPRFDVGAATGWFSRLMPPGFYYKTFMWPPKLWRFYERCIRRAASAAPAPAGPDPDSYLHRHAHCEVLIVGGGPAGLAAALAAGETGARVILAEQHSVVGVSLFDHDDAIDGAPPAAWREQTLAKLRRLDNVTVLPRATVSAYYDHNYLTVAEKINGGEPRMRLWRIRAARVVVAAGAFERPLVFSGNDNPRVMLASAMGAYLRRHAVLAGRSIAVFTNNDSAYRPAIDAAAAGARVEIVDLRQTAGESAQRRALDAGVALHPASAVVFARVAGDSVITHIARVNPDGKAISDSPVSREFDLIAVSGGWSPALQLFAQARGETVWDARLGAFAPGEPNPVNPCFVAGAAAGAGGLRESLRAGFESGARAAFESVGKKPSSSPPAAAAEPLSEPPRHLPFIPAAHPSGRGPGKDFVDIMNDVTVADVGVAVREGYEAVEHFKRYTVAGFGTDQGKSTNTNVWTALADARKISPAQMGHTTFRPPFAPLPFGAVVAAAGDDLFAPARATAMHPWHLQNGAVFEEVGEWKRPRYFAPAAETMAAAVNRECVAARRAVAVMDSSTLGKIDVRGPDAAMFLERVYSNGIASIAPGKCRYGLMLNENGMIFDDGVIARLADDHFHLTTTTGGAAGVMSWLEEWLQTEWPQLRVYCVSVTEQWAVAALCGPRARELLAAVCDEPLDDASLPPFAVRAAKVAGIEARLFRVSFAGEWGCEINVPARAGMHLWKALFAAGAPLGLTAYGTETMHVLRAEKGFVIVGQDTDGQMTPADMGLGKMAAKKTDFLGKRSLARAHTARADRQHFVGLLSIPKESVIPEGAYLFRPDAKPANRVAAATGARLPERAEGHVPSSYWSENLGRAVALAMIENGRARMGETLRARKVDGSFVECKIVAPCFIDSAGKAVYD